MDDAGASAAEAPDPSERARRQAGGMLLLAGIVLVLIVVFGVIALSTASSGPGEFNGYPTPTPTNGWYRIADGESLGQRWYVEFSNAGPCIRVTSGTSSAAITESCGFELPAAEPLAYEAIARERDGEREVLMYGWAIPAVAEIQMRSDGKPVPMVLSTPPAHLQLNLRFFAALIPVGTTLGITVLDRTGEVIFEAEVSDPGGA